jgi:putative hemolysin
MDDDPDGDSILIQILLLLFLTLINGFFSCAEMAMVSVNKNKIKKLADGGNNKAILVQKFHDEPTKFLSTIQVAITLAGFFSSASAATGLSDPLSRRLTELKIPYSGQISLITVTLILSFFTLVFGELVPKRIAMHNPEAISMFSVKPIGAISKFAYPFIRLLTGTTNLVMKIFGNENENVQDMISREEIKSLVEEGQARGVINKKEREMIDSIIEFDDTLAKEVMTPRINVFAIDILEPMEEYLDELLEVKYSRIPVYEDDVDNVIGVLYMKDFMREAIKKGFDNIDIRSIMNKPFLVPDSKNIDELFKEMQLSKTQIAILIDEYGGFSGIVTLEDLVEEVMGDIDDEYDNNAPKIKKIDNSTYLIDGMIPIDELNYKLDLNISSDNFETISGLLIDTLGEIPRDQDDRTIELDGLVFKIESVKKKRIDKIKLYIGTREETVQQS